MGIVASLLYIAVYLFFLALVLRIALDTIRSYAREYRPAGPSLIVFEVVYTVTDPIVLTLRRVIPPLRLGAVALDVSVLIIFFACMIAMSLLSPYVI